MEKVTGSQTKSTDSTTKHKNVWKELGKELDKTGSKLKAIIKPFGELIKPLLAMGAEFLAMVAVLGAMKLAMVSGQLVMKGFRATMVGLGAAAGIAIGAIAGVLGAMRELNIAKMQPLFMKANGGKKPVGGSSGAARMQQFYGDPQLAGFGEAALSGAMTAQMQAGGQADGAFRGQLTRYADFSGGDPKALQSMSAAMSNAQFKGTGKMKGKISGDTYSEMQKSAPGMAAAFEEMAGGIDKANAAASGGKISFDAFNAAIMEGKLKSLEPYNGALAAINNTVIMKLKANLAGLKEQITSVGLGSFKELYGAPGSGTGGKGGGRSIVDAIRESIDKLGVSLKVSLATVAPIIQKTMPGIIDGMSGPFTFLNEKLVALIIRGMNSLDTFGGSFNRWIGIVRNAFSAAAGYIAPFAAAWDTMWDALLSPLLGGLGELFGSWMSSMSGQVKKGSSVFAQWGINIREIFHNFSQLTKALNHFKDIMGPIISSILRMVNFFTKILALPFVSGVLAWVIGINVAFKAMNMLATAIRRVSINLKALTIDQIKNKASLDAATAAAARQAKVRSMGAGMMGFGGNMFSSGGRTTNAGNMRTWWRGTPATAGGEKDWAAGGRIGPNDGGISPGTVLPGAAGAGARGPNGQFLPIPLTQPTEATMGMRSKLAAGLKSPMGGMMLGMAATMAGGYISSKAKKTDGLGQGVGGALSGAGTGAMMGAMLGPAGAAIGAGLGGAVGGIMGVMNARKAHEKQKRETAKNVKDYAFSGGTQTLKALATGMERKKKLRDKLGERERIEKELEYAEMIGDTASVKRLTAQKKALGKFVNGIESLTGAKDGLAEIDKAYSKQKKFLTVNAAFAKLIGKTAEELGEWADRAGIKLDGVSLSLEQLQKSLGYLSGTSKGATQENRGVAATRLGTAMMGQSNKDTEVAKSGIDAVNAAVSFFEVAQGGLSGPNSVIEVNKLMQANALRISAMFSAGSYTDTGRKDASGRKLTAYEVAIANNQEAQLVTVREAIAQGIKGVPLAELIKQISDQNTYLQTTITDFGERSNADPEFLTGVGKKLQELVRSFPTGKGPKAEATWLLDTKAQLDSYLQDQGISLDSIIANADGLFGLIGAELDRQGLTASTNMQNALKEGGDYAARMMAAVLGGATFKEAKAAVEKQIADQKLATAEIENNQARAVALADTLATALAAGDKKLAETTMLALASIQALLDKAGIGPAGPTGPDGPTPGNPAPTVGTHGAYPGNAMSGKKWFWSVSRGEYVQMDLNTRTDANGEVADTATTRFQRTLQAHGALSNMTSGKRTMTSGIRSTNLGSINSDHLTGRAYDLTGQNLGAYASNVKATGGFAEFHGSGGSRHLHVVPGAMGDTASPVGIGMGGPAGTVNNYNIVVNPPPGSSPEAIANEVMNRIAVRQRDSLERR